MIPIIRKYAKYSLIVFIIGFALGQRIGQNFVTPRSTIYYKQSLKGIIFIQSLPTSTGECEYFPNDNPFFDDAIVTDGKNRGYVLGGVSLHDSAEEPDQGVCTYRGEFEVSISPTDVYELAFPDTNLQIDDTPVFNALPEPSTYINPDLKFASQYSAISQSWVRWLLTTISCPNGQEICVRAELR